MAVKGRLREESFSTLYFWYPLRSATGIRCAGGVSVVPLGLRLGLVLGLGLGLGLVLGLGYGVK